MAWGSCEVFAITKWKLSTQSYESLTSLSSSRSSFPALSSPFSLASHSHSLWHNLLLVSEPTGETIPEVIRMSDPRMYFLNNNNNCCNRKVHLPLMHHWLYLWWLWVSSPYLPIWCTALYSLFLSFFRSTLTSYIHIFLSHSSSCLCSSDSICLMATCHTSRIRTTRLLFPTPNGSGKGVLSGHWPIAYLLTLTSH